MPEREILKVNGGTCKVPYEVSTCSEIYGLHLSLVSEELSIEDLSTMLRDLLETSEVLLNKHYLRYLCASK